MQGRSMRSVALLLVALGQHAGGWRADCESEVYEVVVSLHGLPEPPPEGEVARKQCRVAFYTHEDLVANPVDLTAIDYLFTDSLYAVPYAGRREKVFFLENMSTFVVPPELDELMQTKKKLLSILLPRGDPQAWSDSAKMLAQQAEAFMPNDTFIDDESIETHTAAFAPYRFSLIAEDLQNRTVSVPFVRSLAFHTIPLFNGYVELGTMVTQAIADYDDRNVNLPETIKEVQGHNEKAGVLWSYHRILQDQLQYRYNRPFEERLFSQACSVCRLKSEEDRKPALAFVGIYSAKANFEKREAVRTTWMKVLTQLYGFRYKFFLGELSGEALAADELVRREIALYDDIVVLNVEEGYRMNSQKGLLFLEWIALHSNAEFLLKVDDDVYFRPSPLVEQLAFRPPAAYIWGFFDYISPVPREEGHPFCNTAEEFPFDVFPPYPRGVVRVLSMDVVRRIAEASHKGKLRMIYGDDPCLGVHLRQLLFDEEEPLPTLTLDDRDSYRVFAMEPSCHKKLWSKITNRTWAVHHVSAEQIYCMWNTDVEEGYYSIEAGQLEHNTSWPLDGLPDLCGCAPDPSFEERNDSENLRLETLRVLYPDLVDQEEARESEE